jgi:membrane protein implicated in regulation of membrane protease activity
MASNENPAASVAVWYFVGATFVAALPMILLPDLPWPLRLGSIALALALIAGGGAQLRREKRDAARRGDQPPEA